MCYIDSGCTIYGPAFCRFVCGANNSTTNNRVQRQML